MTSCNLIVNYLPADASDTEVETIFAEFGPVESVKIVKNKETGVSMCYGFVVMKEGSDAEKAIQSLNQKPIRGKSLRVSFARPRQVTESIETNNTNLYVSGISVDVDEGILEREFGKCGVIMSCRVLRSTTGTSRGIAFVKYVDRVDAESAIEKFNNKPLCVRTCQLGECICTGTVSVKFALPSNKAAAATSRRTPTENGQTPNNLYSIPYSVQANYANAYTAMYPQTGYNYPQPVAYGYPTATSLAQGASSALYNYYNSIMSTTYNNPYGAYSYLATTQYSSAISPAAQSAYTTPVCSYSAYNNASFCTTTTTAPAIVPGSLTPSSLAQFSTGNHCVFVYGLGQEATEEELQKLFHQFGTISSVRLGFETTNGKRVCKGYGFVNYYSYNDAMQAISSLNNYVLNGHTLQVRFKSVKDSSS